MWNWIGTIREKKNHRKDASEPSLILQTKLQIWSLCFWLVLPFKSIFQGSSQGGAVSSSTSELGKLFCIDQNQNGTDSPFQTDFNPSGLLLVWCFAGFYFAFNFFSFFFSCFSLRLWELTVGTALRKGINTLPANLWSDDVQGIKSDFSWDTLRSLWRFLLTRHTPKYLLSTLLF